MRPTKATNVTIRASTLIDFDPPSQQPKQPHYDIRLSNHRSISNSSSSSSSDRAYVNNTNHHNEEEEEEEGISQEEENELDVSMTWSNAPGIDDSQKSDHTEHAEVEELELSNKSGGNNDTTAATVYEDEDEHNSVFLSWPASPQHEQSPHSSQQQHGEKRGDDESIISDRSWFKWRRPSDSDMMNNLKSASNSPRSEYVPFSTANAVDAKHADDARNENNNDAIEEGSKSDGAVLVPENVQWWQFGRGRSSVESNSDGGSNNLNRDNIDVVDGSSSSSSPEKMLHRRGSLESNRSFTSSVDEEIKSTKKSNRRRSIESNNKSFTSSVDHEVNEWLFPRRGRRPSINSKQSRPTRSLWGGAEAAASSVVSSKPPQSQAEDCVENIVDKLKKSFVELSPIEHALLNDMASTKNTNRWRNKPRISRAGDEALGGSSPPKSLHVGGGELEEVSREELKPTLQQGDNAQQGEPEIYWDSDKMNEMKGGGVSLARARALDEVSSIASSEHSGKIPLKNNIAQRRATLSSFKASFFGWNHTIIEEDADDDKSFKPERIAPRVASGKLSSMKSSIRPKSMVISTQSKVLSKRRSSIDYDDYDDDDMYSKKIQLAEEDLKHERVVKEACEVMNSVNNSVVAMGMNAPFRPIEEICPPFQKLHKNLGYQMDALKAAIVHSTKSPISKKVGLKKSKKLRASNLKGSMFSISSAGSTLDSSNRSSRLNDTDAMSKFVKMALRQSQQAGGGSSITSNVTSHSFHTSWLPNYLWYQTIAADASSIMRPTSLCSGTGITGDEQYLNPEMLKVFVMFSTYFVGSKHLFQEVDDEDDDGAKMRRSYWMDTIEEIGSDENSSSSESVSDESDMVYELDELDADIDQFDAEKQIKILQSVISDLRKSQMNGHPTMLSIKATASSPGDLTSSIGSEPSEMS